MTGYRDLERYFRDPTNPVLAPGSSGEACINLRQALGRLGFGGSNPNFSPDYDTSLVQAVLEFQKHHGHSSLDGRCGPGTRKLLAKVLGDPAHIAVFQRMPDPERRNEGHAFVSYAHEDAARVRPFIELMSGWDYRIWYDDDISPGAVWKDTLHSRIDTAFLVVAFLSRRSVERDWVQQEIMHAGHSGRPILPILLDALPTGHALEEALARHQYFSLSPVAAQGLDEKLTGKLAAALREAHAMRPPEATPPPPPPILR